MPGASIKVTVKGLNKVLSRLQAKGKAGQQAAAGALYLEGSNILNDALRMTPVDFGWLRGSGYVTRPTSMKKPSIELGFGAKYAPFVHGNKSARHDVGEWGFLEKAMKRHRSGFSRRVAKLGKSLLASATKASSIPRTHPSKPRKRRLK